MRVLPSERSGAQYSVVERFSADWQLAGEAKVAQVAEALQLPDTPGGCGGIQDLSLGSGFGLDIRDTLSAGHSSKRLENGLGGFVAV